MKRILLTFNFLIVCCALSFAQLETAVWYFGHNAGLDFNTPEPRVLTDGALDNHEGVATFSDQFGNLLFYTDGRSVWNREHNLMLNGGNLLGHPSSTESAIIVPWPDNPDKYYVFVVDYQINKNGLSYSIVDMTLDGGLGGITEKNVVFEDVVMEKVTAIRHQNNKDFWLLTRSDSNVFIEYLIDASGLNMSSRKEMSVGFVEFPYDPSWDENDPNRSMGIGYMRVSPNGKFVACASMIYVQVAIDEGRKKNFNLLEVFHFDPKTGQLSRWFYHLDPLLNLYGVEFSNDCSKLYYSSYISIYQLDLTVGNPSETASWIGNIEQQNGDDLAGALQLAINGKIYVAQDSCPYLGVIQNPRDNADDVVFDPHGVYLGDGRFSQQGLPNFIPSYFLPPNFEIHDNCTNDITHFVCTDQRNNPRKPPYITGYEWVLYDKEGNQIGPRGKSREFSAAIPDPGKYRISLSVKVSNGEEVSDYRFFEVYDNPEIHLDNDTVICQGGEALLHPVVSDDLDFRWEHTNDDQVLSITTQTTVTGIVTDKYTGCSTSGDVSVKVVEPLQFSLGDDLEFCDGGSVSVLPDFQGNTFVSFCWLDDESDIPGRTFSEPGIYRALTVDEHNCEFVDDIIVTKNLLPEIAFSGDEIICANIPRYLDCGVPNAEYQWNTGDVTQTIRVEEEAVYSVVVTDRKGCVSKDSVELIIKTLPEISLPADTLLCDGDTLMLSAYWFDAQQYMWQDQQIDSLYEVTSPGKYSVKVSNYCGDSGDEIVIKYRFCGEFQFPNIITPNGDGINDYFRIRGLDEYTSGWHLEIYNRLGKRVYYTEDYHNEWNAPDVSDGVYFYRFYRDSDSYKGNITVLHR